MSVCILTVFLAEWETMILITHAVIGAAIAEKMQSSGLIFFTGVLSHYLSDAIPHWHYSVPRVSQAIRNDSAKKTLSFSPRFVGEFIKIAVDGILGFVFAFFFFPGNLPAIALAVFGAMLPDFLIGLSRFYPNSLLILHQRFHRWVHSRIDLDGRPLIGIGTQLAIVVLLIAFFGV